MPRSGLEGLMVRGPVRGVSPYKRKADNAPMIQVDVLVEGEEYRQVHECRIEAEGIHMPTRGQWVEIDIASRVTREGEQYIVAYPGGLRIVERPAYLGPADEEPVALPDRQRRVG